MPSIVDGAGRHESRWRRPVYRLLRVLAVAVPVAAFLGILAHAPGIGWSPMDCYYDTEGALQCGGFVGNPLLWGPSGWPLTPLGGVGPSPVGAAFAVLWWMGVGTFVGLCVDLLLHHGLDL